MGEHGTPGNFAQHFARQASGGEPCRNNGNSFHLVSFKADTARWQARVLAPAKSEQQVPPRGLKPLVGMTLYFWENERPCEQRKAKSE
jgi:hypothetical protein